MLTAGFDANSPAPLRSPSEECGGDVDGRTERRRSGGRDRGQVCEVLRDRSRICPRSRTIVRRYAALVEGLRLAPPTRGKGSV